MDFGGFILFALLALGLFFGGIVVAVLFIKRSPARLRGFGLWLGGGICTRSFG
jgi:hypothetical protein